MPVEIKELVIRAVVEPSSAGQPPVAIAPPAVDRKVSRDEREAIIQACVKRVLRHLERSRER